jgi:dihydrofolate reductase
MITIIAAITAGKGAIGRNGDLLYHLSDDLRHFKELTTGHTVVMGRRTFDSLPKGALPNRRNIVVTRNADYQAVGADVVHSLDEAFELVKDTDDIFVIGGGQIYAEALNRADRMSLTVIDAPDFDDADTFFPAFDPADWEIAEMSDALTDNRSGINYRFIDFARTNP